METLLVATHNQGKRAEIAQLLADVGVACVTLDDVGVCVDVEETGTTFNANAVLKAEGYAQMTGLLTLADDSGLEVEALGGAPGVYTKRFGGAELSQPERNALLLKRLAALDGAARGARFRCVMALARPDGLLGTAEGSLEGEIAMTPAGTGGFGYDPVFFLPDAGRTLAEIERAAKNEISHRARALRAITPLLRQTLSGVG
jgi:XTP/dITP diphosphohydrolase